MGRDLVRSGALPDPSLLSMEDSAFNIQTRFRPLKSLPLTSEPGTVQHVMIPCLGWMPGGDFMHRSPAGLGFLQDGPSLPPLWSPQHAGAQGQTQSWGSCLTCSASPRGLITCSTL